MVFVENKCSVKTAQKTNHLKSGFKTLLKGFDNLVFINGELIHADANIELSLLDEGGSIKKALKFCLDKDVKTVVMCTHSDLMYQLSQHIKEKKFHTDIL